MTRARAYLAALALFASALAPSSMSLAQEPSRSELREAQRLFQQGVELGRREQWGEAVEYFRRSIAIVERPSSVYNLGVALVRISRTTEAERTLRRFLELARASADAELAERMAEAERMLAELRGARIRLILEPPDATVLVDGRPTEGAGSPRTIEVDPGEHVVLVEAPGHERARVEISVLGDATAEQAIRLSPLDEAPAVLAIESSEERTIFVDGQEVGRGRAEHRVRAGEHRVRATAPGVAPLERVVRVAPGERLVFELSAAAPDAAADPWLWVGVGLGALAAGALVATAVVLAQPGAQDPFEGYTGSVGRAFEVLSVRW